MKDLLAYLLIFLRDLVLIFCLIQLKLYLELIIWSIMMILNFILLSHELYLWSRGH